MFTTVLTKAVRQSSIVFIAVGTPQGEDGSADLQHVEAVARDIGRAMNGYKVIVDKSTVPVGTAARVRDIIRRETTHPFSVVSNPEFLKQGAAIDDFLKPDRVVIGAEDARAAEIMRELYAPFTRTGAPVMVMDCASAELSKYAANALLATRISFMNEVANVCEAFGANIDEVRKAIGSDRRIGSSFLFRRCRLRRQLLPEGRQGHSQVRRRQGLRLRDAEGGRERQPAAEGRLVAKMQAHFGTLSGQDDRALGTRVQAAHRRHARSAGHHHRRTIARGRSARAGLRSGSVHASHAACSGRRSIWRTRATTRSKAPTPSPWSRSGMSSVSPTFRGCES